MWFQGEDKAPEICKACLRSLRYWYSDKKIITLDKNNISDYIDLPGYIIDKHEKGIISNAHYSDIIRLQLLIEHGGTWIDSTVYCTGRNSDYIFRLPLFLFRVNSSVYAAISNWFMVSAPSHPVISLTRDLLLRYWKEHNYLDNYFIFHEFFKISAEVYQEEWNKVPFVYNNPCFEMQYAMYEDYSEERMKYFEGISDFHKMTYKIDCEHPPYPTEFYQHITGKPPSESSIYRHIVRMYS